MRRNRTLVWLCVSLCGAASWISVQGEIHPKTDDLIGDRDFQAAYSVALTFFQEIGGEGKRIWDALEGRRIDGRPLSITLRFARDKAAGTIVEMEDTRPVGLQLSVTTQNRPGWNEIDSRTDVEAPYELALELYSLLREAELQADCWSPSVHPYACWGDASRPFSVPPDEVTDSGFVAFKALVDRLLAEHRTPTLRVAEYTQLGPTESRWRTGADAEAALGWAASAAAALNPGTEVFEAKASRGEEIVFRVRGFVGRETVILRGTELASKDYPPDQFGSQATDLHEAIASEPFALSLAGETVPFPIPEDAEVGTKYYLQALILLPGGAVSLSNVVVIEVVGPGLPVPPNPGA